MKKQKEINISMKLGQVQAGGVSPRFRADWWVGKVPVRKRSDRGWGLRLSSWEHFSGFWFGGLDCSRCRGWGLRLRSWEHFSGFWFGGLDCSSACLRENGQACWACRSVWSGSPTRPPGPVQSYGSLASRPSASSMKSWLAGQGRGILSWGCLPCFVSKDPHVGKLTKKGSSNHSLQGPVFCYRLG